ncbi:MAG: dihydrolipoyllysine-residue acetyltransferase [Pseudomonadota bacterium]
MAAEKLNVPDLGTDDSVEVIEILVKPGDILKPNDSVVVLESDKAAMEIPATAAGVVKEVLVKVGAQVKTGSPLLIVETAATAAGPTANAPKSEPAPAAKVEAASAAAPAAATAAKAAAPAPEPVAAGSKGVETIVVPDLGGAADVEVIDVLVKVGDTVKKEQGLVTLETDKAAMEVPSPKAGKVVAIKMKLGDKVSQGSVILDLETDGAASSAAPAKAAASAPKAADTQQAPAKTTDTQVAASDAAAIEPKTADGTQSGTKLSPASVAVAAERNPNAEIYAGPAVRMLARQLGVDLSKVTGSGGKGRIVKEDVQAYVKSRMSGATVATSGAVTSGSGIPAIDDIDFSKFGAIEEVEMTKLHRVTALNMTKNWLNVPHVTQFDEADITDLETFRNEQKALADKKGIKLTPLPFIVKACAKALAEHPQFNVSMHSSGTKLIRKSYVHIGVAVATPAGLMVPVIKNADQKSIWQIGKEIAELSAKAKDRKLSREDMEGGCFTISSLGNIGGNGFTPIVNAPEVAILGVSRASIKPVWKNNAFVPRTMLPFSLSYDHRAVNGVDGGMFCTYLASLLGDIRLMML